MTTSQRPAIEPAAAVEKAAAIDAPPIPGGVERPFVRVLDLRTGHEFDVHRQSLDPENHRLVKGVEDSWTSRPATPNPNPGPVKG